LKHGPDLTLQEEEDRKVFQLRVRVDLVCAILAQQRMTLDEALELIRAVKKYALEQFPDKEWTFDMIYGSRFRRVLSERFPIC
jgi:hypothetical protein